jgi:hypothetical protein
LATFSTGYERLMSSAGLGKGIHTNESFIDGVRGVNKRGEASCKKDFFQALAEERKIRECAKSPEALSHDSPFAIFGLLLVAKQDLTNELAIPDYSSLIGSVLQPYKQESHQCCQRGIF